MTSQRADAATQTGRPADDAAGIRVRLDEMLSRHGITLTELSARVDVTVVNLPILKNGRARAIRFTTMARLCEALHCQPGDLLSYEPPGEPGTGARPLPTGKPAAAPAAPAGPRPAQES